MSHSCKCAVKLSRLTLGSLYGLTLHQAYRYFRLYPNDSKWLNILVGISIGIIVAGLQADVQLAQVAMVLLVCLSNYGSSITIANTAYIRVAETFTSFLGVHAWYDMGLLYNTSACTYKEYEATISS